MVSKIFDKGFHGLCFIIFAAVTFAAVCSVFGLKRYVLAAAVAVAFTAASVFGFYFLKKRFSDMNNKTTNIIFLVMLGAMLVVQFILAVNMLSKPLYDLEVVDKIARNFAESGNMSGMYENIPEGNEHYLARYPNNNGITLLLSFYYRILYLILGRVPYLSGTILNTLFISAAVVLCFLTSKKVFGNFTALVTMLLCVLFLPYYTYCTVFYTDSLSMPFVILTVYLFICGYEAKKFKGKILFTVFSGVSCAVGYVLKGSVLLVLAAIIVYLIYRGKIKKILISAVPLISGFLAFMLIFNCLVSALQISTDEELNENKYPLIHWVMMGLNGNGNYSKEDSEFTRNAGNYDEKLEADLEELKNRLSDYSFLEFTEHLAEKSDFTWSDGTYWITYRIYKACKSTIFSQIFISSGKYYSIFKAVSNGIHISMLAMICASLFVSLVKRRKDPTMLFHILLFGVYIFFLIWEARSRYLFNFTPIFILMWTDGIINSAKLIGRLANRKGALQRRLPAHKSKS